MPFPTVLVTDDDESIREVTQLALELIAGWTVVTADGGAAALAMAREHQPDVILMDMMMPGMDGLTAVAHLKADDATRDIPVILLTAKAQVGPSQPWDGHPVQGVIPKPFEARQLGHQISAMLGWPEGD